MKRQQLLLILLFGLVVAAVYAWMASPKQGRIAQVARTEQAASRVVNESRRIGEALRLDLLEREAGTGAAVKRDIFNFYSKPAPPVIPKPAPRPVQKPVVPPPPVSPPVSVPTEAPPARFRLLGQVDTGRAHKVFLTDEKHLYIVSQGDTFGPAGEYLVENLDDAEVVIRQEGRTAATHIRLVDIAADKARSVPGPGAGKAPSPGRQAAPAGRLQFRSFKKYQP